MSSGVEKVWDQAVEAGAIPVSGPYSHADLFRALAFGVEAGSPAVPTPTPVSALPLSQRDIQTYVSMRLARCDSGQEVKDRILRKLEDRMTPELREAVEVRLAEVEAGAIYR